MITAYGDQDTRRKAIEGGAAGLFTKPIDFPELRHTPTFPIIQPTLPLSLSPYNSHNPSNIKSTTTIDKRLAAIGGAL